MQNHPRVEGDEASRRGQQRVDIDFLYPVLLSDQLTESDEQLIQLGEIDRAVTAHPFERVEDACLLDQPPRKRGVERRQCKRSIFENLDQLTARAEEEHRTELRIEAAAQDQFAAHRRYHRFDRYAQEILVSVVLAN